MGDLISDLLKTEGNDEVFFSECQRLASGKEKQVV